MKKEVVQHTFSKEELELREKANPKCSKCYGTGRRGFIVSQHGFNTELTPIKCKCVIKYEQLEKERIGKETAVVPQVAEGIVSKTIQ